MSRVDGPSILACSMMHERSMGHDRAFRRRVFKTFEMTWSVFYLCAILFESLVSIGMDGIRRRFNQHPPSTVDGRKRCHDESKMNGR